MKKKWHCSLMFVWFDFWIGLFIDVEKHSIYICLLPMFPIRIWFSEHLICPICDACMEKTALLDGESWLLDWGCPECDHYTEGEIDWPFGDRWMTSDELARHGFRII